MGFIEDKAALELARQENNRAKAAEAAAVLNMNSGLAGLVGKSAGYQTNGLTDQEANAIAQSNAIKQRAYEAVAADQYAKSKAYAQSLPSDNGTSWDGTPVQVPVAPGVDAGLAAKWMQSYKGNR